MAIRDTPELDRRDLKRTFEVSLANRGTDSQQFTLALNFAENFLFLQRPYFVRAIHEHMADPLQSPFGDAYLAVVERSSVRLVFAIFRTETRLSSKSFAVCMSFTQRSHRGIGFIG